MASPHMLLNGNGLGYRLGEIASPVQCQEPGHLFACHRVVRADPGLRGDKETCVFRRRTGKACLGQHHVDILGKKPCRQLAVMPVQTLEMRRLRRVKAVSALGGKCRHDLVIDGVHGDDRILRGTGGGIVEGLGGGDFRRRVGDVGCFVDDRDDIARTDAKRRCAR